MSEFLSYYWPLVLAGIERLFASAATLHAVLCKRDTRAVIGWVGLIWLTPLVGWFLYYCFGINRIQRKGSVLQKELQVAIAKVEIPVPSDIAARIEEAKRSHPNFSQLAEAVGKLTERPLLPGNRVTPLMNGDEAFPEMLAAINGAQHSVTLLSYIFDIDEAGRPFVEALVRAIQRGVQVRVLIDDVGSKYSRPNAVRTLQQRGIECEAFLPTRYPALIPYANLRNHRKTLVVDGVLGFTGGMNIRGGCLLESNPKYPVQDMHFKFEGPVVSHLQEVFLMDWAYATGELLEGESWLPVPPYRGKVLARGIADGPDEDFERLLMTVLSGIAVADKRIVIVTPYFLPDSSLIRALNVAALRGVKVTILLPRKSNNFLVQWASSGFLRQVLEGGSEIYLTDPPFDHTKLMMVDNAWALVGSTNLDPRSLRLNFEFNVECYSPDLVADLWALVDQKLASASQLTLEELDSRSFILRVRDGVVRLLTPYL